MSENKKTGSTASGGGITLPPFFPFSMRPLNSQFQASLLFLAWPGKRFSFDTVVSRPEGSQPPPDPIGSFFARYNTIFYHSPGEVLDVPAFHQAFIDTLLYKLQDPNRARLDLSDFRISVYCDAEPTELFSWLQEECHWTPTRYDTGIYRLTGGLFKMQILVTSQLRPNEYPYLTVLTEQLDWDRWDAFCRRAEEDLRKPNPSKAKAGEGEGEEEMKDKILNTIEVVGENNRSFFLADKRGLDSLTRLCALLASLLIPDGVSPGDAVDQILSHTPDFVDRAEVLSLVMGMQGTLPYI